jgi:hypothetical protein
MPSIKFSPDQAVAYKLHRRALAEGRSIAAVVKNIVDKEMAVASVPDAVATHDNGAKKVVAAYLSSALADAIQHIATETSRSTSWVLRDLVRCELRRRGILAPAPEKSEGVHHAAD